MPVIRGLQIRIDPKEVLRRQARENPPPAVLEATQWAIARAYELVEPALAYNVLESKGVEGEELVLEGDIRRRAACWWPSPPSALVWSRKCTP